MFWNYILTTLSISWYWIIGAIFIYIVGRAVALNGFSKAPASERRFIITVIDNNITNILFYFVGYIILYSIGMVWQNKIYQWIFIVLYALLFLSDIFSLITSIVSSFILPKGSKAINNCVAVPQTIEDFIWGMFGYNILLAYGIIK